MSPRFDVVSVAGQARVACAVGVLPYIDRSSLILINDYKERPHYT